MSPTFSMVRVRERLDSPERRKFAKYAFASVISVIITQVILFFCFYALRMSGGKSAFIASSIAAVPSFYLNRNWVWGKSGRSHLRKEVLPFWVMVVIGLVFSSLAGRYADVLGRDLTDSHFLRSVIVTGSNIGAFGILWILKYIIFNRILFAHHPEDMDPALDGRSGLPT
jgi:putative flippase GtrA